MCAINPTHKKRIILDVYTSQLMEDFDQRVIERVLELEQQLNSENMAFRWHVKETEQEAE